MQRYVVYFFLLALGTSCGSNIKPETDSSEGNNKSVVSESANAPMLPPMGTPSGVLADAQSPVGAAPGISGPALTAGTAFPGDMPISGPMYDAEINDWVETVSDHFSTFAADVDTSSYTYARAMLNMHEQPTPKQIRVEEFLNYFPYNYPEPEAGDAFSVTLDSAVSPFTKDATILRVGIKGKERLENAPRKKVNLVFLTDVSGSMQGPARLDLAKSAMETLINNLQEDDKIAIVTYASSSKVLLPLTKISNRAAIVDGIYGLSAGGSTAMGDGINLAYNEAEKGLSEDTITRVVILSDGDANVGKTSHEEILSTIADQVKKGIYLTTVGFGLGNYRDEMMEQLANKGNGNNYYVDSLTEAKRVFQAEVSGTLDIIAKDLKIQVDFDPKKVESYRLIGYENRDIADNDFRNDDVDAGELGPGHRVTALYEVKPKSKIQDGLATVRLRYKDPDVNDQSFEKAYSYLYQNNYASLNDMPRDFRLGLTAAGFAEVLRNSPYRGELSIKNIEEQFASFIDENNAIETELMGLIKKAK